MHLFTTTIMMKRLHLLDFSITRLHWREMKVF